MDRLLMGTSVFVVVEYIIKILAVGIVPENRRPSSSSAWLLLIFFLPIVGVPLFLMFGSPYISRRRARIQSQANQLLAKGTDTLPTVPESVTLPAELSGIVELTRRLTKLPMVTGTNAGVEMDYEASIERITRLVETAQETVHAEIYIIARDATTEGFFTALEDAVQRGGQGPRAVGPHRVSKVSGLPLHAQAHDGGGNRVAPDAAVLAATRQNAPN